MFSDHVKKPSRFPQAGLLVMAAGLVIVCQLIAMAMVADRQVQRAGVRDLQRVTQQLALSDCIQRSTGATRHICVRQSQQDAYVKDVNSGATEIAIASPAVEPGFAVKNIAVADGSMTGSSAELIRVGISGVSGVSGISGVSFPR
jgi:hypothetical protein